MARWADSIRQLPQQDLEPLGRVGLDLDRTLVCAARASVTSPTPSHARPSTGTQRAAAGGGDRTNRHSAGRRERAAMGRLRGINVWARA